MTLFKRLLIKITPNKHKTPDNEPESFTQRIKDHYWPEFIALQGIINRHDPAFLISYGCPEDEYDPETARIIVLLKPKMGKKAIFDIIYRVFDEMLSAGAKIDSNKAAFKKFVRDVYKWNIKRPTCRSFCSEI